MYGQVKDEDKEKWKHYFDFHQNNDGFFYDVNIENGYSFLIFCIKNFSICSIAG